jgi:hypothetical protein
MQTKITGLRCYHLAVPFTRLLERNNNSVFKNFNNKLNLLCYKLLSSNKKIIYIYIDNNIITILI